MSLMEEVKTVCRRLAPLGWGGLLARHGLRLDAPDQGGELARKLAVDRTVAGFEDFCLAGERGIEPGHPAASLLYHALASPDVHPTADGSPAAPSAYPTLAELDAIENYIYSLAPPDLSALKNPAIAVFAYQYRPASSSTHGYHADLAFSRTGVSRVGTRSPVYDGRQRCFRPDPLSGDGIAATPARYAAFLAEARRPVNADPIMGRRDQNDPMRVFLFPVHKLFDGIECLPGQSIAIAFREFHVNEKLRRVHVPGGIPVVDGFDIDAAPFLRTSDNGGKLVELQQAGASILVAPTIHGALVRTARQKNTRSGKEEIVRFKVPPATTSNRFSTSLQIPPVNGVRTAPEYLNLRHRVERNATNGELTVIDMQDWPESEFQAALRNGKYEAAHFVDDTCDGVVTVAIDGLTAAGAAVPMELAAYSLVTAPDFFPLADQLEVTNWVRRNLQNLQEHFSQGSPWPLCEGRMPANLELPVPGAPAGRRAFDARRDQTITAVVGTRPLSTETNAPDRKKRFVSFLPDAASNEFAPGWDVSLSGSDGTAYYAAYGLGSPFPEDAKLCAALNSFWPAVAPDASRTFRFTSSPTAMPLLDEEIGLHPDHPEVRAGRATGQRGWDGEYGPYFETVDGTAAVNHASLERSDYVSNTLNGRVSLRATASLDAAELIRRMDALRRCIAALPPDNDLVSTTQLWLVSAKAVPDWSAPTAGRGDSALDGDGYLYVFATVNGAATSAGQDVTRRRVPLIDRYECQIASRTLAFRKNGGAWVVVQEAVA
ncbi:hypothetical protein C1S70_31010 (plasmid) [Azospirillum argentinense]|uniref:Uncharacterized protein n=1 Tax=Azospirillum argentinense TaxID=2970906 RepID=A0A2K1FR77_9PROT|nr:hypothetical protein [Azospirillum argentinense]PNQ95037.1 hypothetical protein C1S70_31010 [Azospirillum argentinense]